MKRDRTWLNLLLGLVLLVQGLAVAAAPRGVASRAPAATEAASMPAHCPDMAAPGEASDPAGPSCCDASCPDMTTCALGHSAAAITIGPIGIRPADTFGTSPPGPFPLARAPGSPLRPPNPLLHA
jgi:hypothetical protein